MHSMALAICVGASQISPDGRRKLKICVATSQKMLRNGGLVYAKAKLEGRKYVISGAGGYDKLLQTEGET